MASRILLIALASSLALAGCSKKPSPQAKRTPYPAEDKLQVVDLSRYYQDRLGKDAATIAHRQTIDGLVFHIDGRVVTYGQSQVNWDNRDKPDADATSTWYPDRKGIPVGRAFEELHLIHATYWPDVEGETIALIRLNYADGTKEELPIIYGGHVRDFQRIRTEEKELLTDPNSKVIWRGTGVSGFKSTQRLFKSMLPNPHPEKVVTTVDVISTRRLAAYQLLAATTADHAPSRPVTPPFPADELERHFDGAVTVHVVDAATGQPVAGALMHPYMDTDGPYMVAAPFFTTDSGDGDIRYPKGRTAHMSLSIEKTGYARSGTNWSADFPASATFRLTQQ